MIALLSPSKKLHLGPRPEPHPGPMSAPLFQAQTAEIVRLLQSWSPQKISEFMKVSAAIANENTARFNHMSFPMEDHPDAIPALFLFSGDAYQGLDARSLSDNAVDFLNRHLRILSGLYGVLRPTDLILPYRLEMGSGLAVGGCKNLYEFWRETITTHLDVRLANSEERAILNTASGEYSKAVDFKKLQARVVEPIFLELKDNKYRKISVFMKKARGLMVRYMATEGIDRIDELRGFNLEGYRWDAEQSTKNQWVFTR